MELDRLSKAVKAVVEAFTSKIDYLALYPGEVYSQDADGGLQIFPDNQRIPKFAGVPLRTAFPQCKVEVPKGTRVLLGFEEGDPSKPYASLWDSKAGSVTLVTLGDDGAAQFVALANLVKNELEAIKSEFDSLATYVSGHAHPVVISPPSSSPPPTPHTNGYSVGSVAASKLKTE